MLKKIQIIILPFIILTILFKLLFFSFFPCSNNLANLNDYTCDYNSDCTSLNINSNHDIDSDGNLLDIKSLLTNDQLYISANRKFVTPYLWYATYSNVIQHIDNYYWSVNFIDTIDDDLHASVNLNEIDDTVAINIDPISVTGAYILELSCMKKDNFLISFKKHINLIVSDFTLISSSTINLNNNTILPVSNNGYVDIDFNFYFSKNKISPSDKHLSYSTIYLLNVPKKIDFSFNNDFSKMIWSSNENVIDGDHTIASFIITYTAEDKTYNLSVFINCVFLKQYDINISFNTINYWYFNYFSDLNNINLYDCKVFSLFSDKQVKFDISWSVIVDENVDVSYQINDNGNLSSSFKPVNIGLYCTSSISVIACFLNPENGIKYYLQANIIINYMSMYIIIIPIIALVFLSIMVMLIVHYVNKHKKEELNDEQ